MEGTAQIRCVVSESITKILAGFRRRPWIGRRFFLLLELCGHIAADLLELLFPVGGKLLGDLAPEEGFEFRVVFGFEGTGLADGALIRRIWAGSSDNPLMRPLIHEEEAVSR